MIRMNNNIESMITAVKERITLLEQSNRNPEKFEMLLRTLESKQAKRQGRMEVKEIKPTLDFEIDLNDIDMEVEFDFEPSPPKATPWDDLIKRNESEKGSE